MITLRRAFVILSVALVISIFLAACGGQTPATTGSGSANTSMNSSDPMTGTSTPTGQMMTTPTMQATKGMKATPTATSGMSVDNGNKSAFIHTAFVTISGKKVHVLTNNKGFLLYYYMKDTMMTSQCTGACAQSWPPLLAPQSMMTITSSIVLPRKLSVHKTGNGNQVFYDGHPLYTYVGDMTAGQFTGRGMGKAWYLVGFTL